MILGSCCTPFLKDEPFVCEGLQHSIPRLYNFYEMIAALCQGRSFFYKKRSKMKKSFRLSFWSRPLRLSSWSVAIGSIAFLLAACGDEVTNQVIQDNMSIVSTTQELPKCMKDNEGEQAFVKGEKSERICVDGKWESLNSSGKDTVLVKDTIVIEKNSTCTTKELKDKSGVKIICGGDSVGVVLNGKNGTNGKDGSNGKDGTSGKDGVSCSVENKTDSTVTIACGTDTFTMSLGGSSANPDTGNVVYEIENASISGVSQKGPFVKGSSVTAVELDGSKSLLQTGRSFVSVITQDDGCFNMRNVTLKSSYVRLSVNGYYRNEVTGKNSTLPITLNAVTDLDARNTVNVNLLTHLEYERVAYLMAHGDGTLKIKKLKKQAEGEIFKAFYCDDLADFGYSEDLNVFGKTDADAALLAISILLQGDRDEADLVVLLTEISNAFAEKGTWTDSMTKVILADWALKADSENRLALFRKNVAGWHLGDTVPEFEKFVRNYVNVESGLGTCGDKNNPVGSFAHVPNKHSGYYAKAYDSIDAAKNSLVRVVCDDKGGKHWRIATDLERDTKGWEKDSAGTVRKGQIDTSLTYVYEDGWRHGTDLDRVVGFGCIKAFKDTVAKVTDTSWYACAVSTDENSAWYLLSNREKDSVFLKAYKDSIPGLLLDAPFTKKTLVWDADTLREANDNEILLKKACVTSKYETRDTLSNTLTYTCDESGWSKTGTFIDRRNWLTYMAVQIGDQVWMAENLNYEVDSSFCYEKDESNCAKYGRLYKWAAAVGKSEKDCGFGHTCSLPSGNIQGVCPMGWHLPSTAEWESLLAAVGGKSVAGTKLKTRSGWNVNGNGLDAFAFSALPAGSRSSSNGDYHNEGYRAGFWSSTEYGSDYAYFMNLIYRDDDAGLDYGSKSIGFSVRCVMNSGE